MKLIKLDRRHNLYHKGYTYAFLFTRYGKDVPMNYEVERYVCDAEGLKWYDNTYYGKPKKGYERTPYYVGFRNESTATVVMLKLA